MYDYSNILRNHCLPRNDYLIRIWHSWYEGHVLGFHNHKIYNGTNNIEYQRMSLKMAKKVCEDWANYLLNEKCEAVLDTENNEQFQNMISDIDLLERGNEAIEMAFALGLSAVVLSLENMEMLEDGTFLRGEDTRLELTTVDRTRIYPIKVKNKRIIECAFVSDDNVVMHKLNEKKEYIIENYRIVKSDECDIHGNFNNKLEYLYTIPTFSKRAWFMILKPNLTSNFFEEQLGISVFANSIDVLKSIDNKYDGFNFEFVAGRKRIFIASDGWNVNMESGERIKTFDPLDTVFHALPTDSNGNNIITTVADDLRYDAFIQGLNTDLSLLSSKCGMGEIHYRFDGKGTPTATQIISENSALYTTIKKHEKYIRPQLTDFCRAIISANNTFTSNEQFNEEALITIIFDDSIIEDTGTLMERDKRDVELGIMSKWEYREKWYGESQENAREIYRDYFTSDLLIEYNEPLMNGTITPEIFVNKVFGENYPDKENLIAYITENKNAQSTPFFNESFGLSPNNNQVQTGIEEMEDINE